jgi:hypothetical protein
MTYQPSFLANFIAGLTYVLAVDNNDCDDSVDLYVLERRLSFLASMRAQFGLDETCWCTVHCVHYANPLTYSSGLNDPGAAATLADLATVWREYLHQGLFVQTTGSGGRDAARCALRAFACTPRLTSQVRLVITSEDPQWRSKSYIDNLAADLRILQPLWQQPADPLVAIPDARHLQLVLRAPESDKSEVRTAAEQIMLRAGMASTLVATTLENPQMVMFELPEVPPIDRAGEGVSLGIVGQPQSWFGIRTNGALFIVDPVMDIEMGPDYPAMAKAGYIDQIHLAARRSGWAA